MNADLTDVPRQQIGQRPRDGNSALAPVLGGTISIARNALQERAEAAVGVVLASTERIGDGIKQTAGATAEGLDDILGLKVG
ncbi:hypothetical protein [Serinicoccus sp. CUA-874]|uniref:hypothetical protein n=1 Tax=Serinicoccus sp. CUA-874 TaxID=1517939 RepID=UPI001179C490|nr:hypothetical protein [Serinicoccus sp. CUA-874]